MAPFGDRICAGEAPALLDRSPSRSSRALRRDDDSRTDWWTRPPQTSLAAVLTALAVGVTVFAVQAAVRDGDLAPLDRTRVGAHTRRPQRRAGAGVAGDGDGDGARAGRV